MRPDRQATLVVAGCMVAMWVVAVWAVALDGAQGRLWLVPAVVALGLWAMLEVTRGALGDHAKERIVTLFLRYFMAWVALSLTTLILVRTMTTLDGVASAWATGGPRASGLIVAVGLILFGNALPTLPAPSVGRGDAATHQRVRRFVAWTVTLTGLGVGVAWIAMDPALASQTTNRLLALCFFLICGRTLVSLLDRPAVGSPTSTRPA